ncbi:O-antigen ligase family protein [Candidatus Puniceispirillum sp.]|nr:O-antigen ligase family protein [Candidatus Puniceispirillum sp.]
MFFNMVFEGKKAIMKLSLTDRFFHIFWLLGPFVLLIERTPADVWISLLSLAFVFRVLKNRDFEWLEHFWVRAAFAFWAACILSAILSSDPLYAFSEAVIWFRFPLFVMASVFWLAKDRQLLYLMLVSTALAFLTMCGILAAEIIYTGQVGQRLTWPFGDKVSGNYLTKVGLPVIVIGSTIAASKFRRVNILAASFVLIGFVTIVLTGERINTLILFSAGILAGVVHGTNWKRFNAMLLIVTLSVVLLLFLYPNVGKRYVVDFLIALPTGDHSPYYRAMMSGLLAFEKSPLFGIGTANFYNLCPNFSSIVDNMGCQPHPHNYYIQLLAETGVVGFLFGVVFLWSLVWKCLKTGWKMEKNLVLSSAWIVPFALFWPIASTADFFGQWNNVFMWSSIALALSSTNLDKNSV